MQVTSRNQAQIVRVLECCRDIESNCAKLYGKFAELFREDRELSSLWRKTAAEEENHARQFMLAINLRNLQMISEVKTDVAEVEKMLRETELILDGVGAFRPSAVDAILSAIELEEKLAKFHMDTMATFTDESFRKLYSAMMKDDLDHVKSLQEAYSKLMS